METFQSTTDFRLSGVQITSVDGETLDITALISSVDYVESVYMPFVSATMVTVDSGGLLQNLPIQGMEKVKIAVKTNIRGENFEYNLEFGKLRIDTHNKTLKYTPLH